MKSLVLTLVALCLFAAACGGSDSAATTQVVTTTAAGGVTTTAASTTTAGGSASGGAADCREIWPDATLQEITGEPYTFFAANDDATACTFMSVSNGITLGWRNEDADGWASSKAGATTVYEPEDAGGICDGAFSIDVGGAVFLMEAYSASQNRVYHATLSAVGVANAPAWAAALLAAAC